MLWRKFAGVWRPRSDVFFLNFVYFHEGEERRFLTLGYIREIQNKKRINVNGFIVYQNTFHDDQYIFCVSIEQFSKHSDLDVHFEYIDCFFSRRTNVDLLIYL